MTYWPLLLILLPVCILLLFLAVRLLFRGGWVGGFLRGLIGIGSLLVIVLLGYLVVDLAAYRALRAETTIATLSFTQSGPQRYDVQLSRLDEDSEESYELTGDEWQLDARVLTWTGPLTVLGMEPVYRLERLSGRYRDLTQERSGDRRVHSLEERSWLSIQQFEPWLPWVDARFGSAAYLPMVDGGIFEVGLTSRGLVARPVNEPARAAVGTWSSE
ncbi:hypothetical protein [Saccharospirillum mangrovi]|uniref:hypothetical protein n=1 Tax=Saccharospirillum mangrovi TaxID=2161747 RepID=UPI000D36620F|nr:hypothetical protein [Saccharospirillum mangrovi]